MAGSAVSTANSSIIDVRGIQPPDNILTILRKVTELPPGAKVEICIDSNPFQLYDLLQQRGYFLDLVPQPDGTFRGAASQRNIDALVH